MSAAARLEVLPNRGIEIEIQAHPDDPCISEEPERKDKGDEHDRRQNPEAPSHSKEIAERHPHNKSEQNRHRVAEYNRSAEIAAFPRIEIPAFPALTPRVEPAVEDRAFKAERASQTRDREDEVTEG